MDHRDRSHYPAGIKQDEDRMVLIVNLDYIPDLEDGTCPPNEYPAKYDVCPDCDGQGKYVNPSVDSHGGYFSGLYYVSCRSCGGKRVILVPTTHDGKQLIQRVIDEDRAYHAEVASERRFGY